MEAKNIPKLIMVDQLWMWVLDEQTIITSFPRRCGQERCAPDDIHRSIRVRLGNAPKNQIRSIFDLALIIVEECSSAWFGKSDADVQIPQCLFFDRSALICSAG